LKTKKKLSQISIRLGPNPASPFSFPPLCHWSPGSARQRRWRSCRHLLRAARCFAAPLAYGRQPDAAHPSLVIPKHSTPVLLRPVLHRLEPLSFPVRLESGRRRASRPATLPGQGHELDELQRRTPTTHCPSMFSSPASPSSPSLSLPLPFSDSRAMLQRNERRALAALTPPRCRPRHLAASLEAKDDELARAFNPRDKRFGARRQAELLTMSSTSAAQPLLLSPSAECATQLTHMHAHANNSIASSQPPAPALSLFLQVSKSKQQSSLAQPQLMHEPATLLSSLFYPLHEATNELARQSRCDRTPTMPSCCILLHKPGHRACHGQRPNLCAVLT